VMGIRRPLGGAPCRHAWTHGPAVP
jgi:hypothetical protein